MTDFISTLVQRSIQSSGQSSAAAAAPAIAPAAMPLAATLPVPPSASGMSVADAPLDLTPLPTPPAQMGMNVALPPQAPLAAVSPRLSFPPALPPLPAATQPATSAIMVHAEPQSERMTPLHPPAIVESHPNATRAESAAFAASAHPMAHEVERPPLLQPAPSATMAARTLSDALGGRDGAELHDGTEVRDRTEVPAQSRPPETLLPRQATALHNEAAPTVQRPALPLSTPLSLQPPASATISQTQPAALPHLAPQQAATALPLTPAQAHTEQAHTTITPRNEPSSLPRTIAPAHQSAPARSVDVHIGSIEVRLVSNGPQRQAVETPPMQTPAAPVAPFAEYVARRSYSYFGGEG